MNNMIEKLAPYALAFLRWVTVYLFIWHATAKFWEFPISMTGGNGPVTDPMMIVGGIIEIVGSVLIALGWFTRPAAFILAGQSFVGYFLVHVASKGEVFMPLLNGGELLLVYAVLFFLFFINGAGAFSIDNRKRY